MPPSQTAIRSSVADIRVARILLTALAPIIWGSTYLVTTEWLPAGVPFTAAAVRALPAGILLLLCQPYRVPRSYWGKILLLSFLNIGAFQSLLFMAAYRLPGGLAAVVGACQPLIVLLVAWRFEQVRPARTRLILAVVAVAAMALLVLSPNSQWDAVGLTAASVGTVSMALGTYLASRWQGSIPLRSFTGWQLALGGLMLLPAALLWDAPIVELKTGHLIAFAYLSLFGALAAYSLWFRGLRELPPASVSALGLLSPVTAILLGWIALGQNFALREWLGVLAVLVSILCFQLQGLRRRPIS